MKKVILSMIVAFIVFALFYLCGGFVYADFNIKNWDQLGRGFIGWMAMAFSLIGAGVTYSILSHE